MTINRTHLAPCPFCGASAHATPEHRPTRMAEHVMCLGCGAELDGPGSIEQWNTRAQAQAAPEAEPVQVEAVATTKENEDGELYLDWLLEGGISALEFPGQLLLVAHGSVTNDTGQGQVYTAPQHDAELIELLERVVDRLRKAQMFDLSTQVCAKLATLSAKP